MKYGFMCDLLYNYRPLQVSLSLVKNGQSFSHNYLFLHDGNGTIRLIRGFQQAEGKAKHVS